MGVKILSISSAGNIHLPACDDCWMSIPMNFFSADAGFMLSENEVE
jgi:hypothetical protein